MLKKKNTVTFIDRFGLIPEDFKPLPAKKLLPKWYKETVSFVNQLPNYETTIEEEFGRNTGIHGKDTIKRCVPVFDSISAGYLLRTTQDIIVYDSPVEDEKGWPWYRWAGDWELIRFHQRNQLYNYPFDNYPDDYPIPKIVNPWGIKTNKGYSCQIIPPQHRENIIQILPGVVDTDTYNVPVEFPFVLKDPSWRGLIPAGTPYAQIIPFKREKFGHDFKTDKDFEVSPIAEGHERLKATFDNGYRHRFWTRKEYN